MSGFAVASLDELDRVPVAHGLEWRPVRRRFGIRAFGVNAYTAEKAGDWVVEQHDESRLGHEELYVVVRGRARFTIAGEEVDAPAGTLVFLGDPALERVAVAEEAGTTVLAVGGKPGEAFQPSAWEWYFLAEAQPPEQGLETMRGGVDLYPENGAMRYHLARHLARAERPDEARRELARALALAPDLERYVADDDDLAAL